MSELIVQNEKKISQGKLIMVREKSGKSQGILLYSNCGHPVINYIVIRSFKMYKIYRFFL